jgi:hypothetical protein
MVQAAYAGRSYYLTEMFNSACRGCEEYIFTVGVSFIELMSNMGELNSCYSPSYF